MTDKGGLIFHIPKPSGDPHRCSGSRGILAQTALAKVIQKGDPEIGCAASGRGQSAIEDRGSI